MTDEQDRTALLQLLHRQQRALKLNDVARMLAWHPTRLERVALALHHEGTALLVNMGSCGCSHDLRFSVGGQQYTHIGLPEDGARAR